MMNFTVDDEQEKKFKEWAKRQPKRSARAAGDAGFSQFEFIFNETNVGTVLTVRNIDNGEKLDLTDYKSW